MQVQKKAVRINCFNRFFKNALNIFLELIQKSYLFQLSDDGFLNRAYLPCPVKSPGNIFQGRSFSAFKKSTNFRLIPRFFPEINIYFACGTFIGWIVRDHAFKLSKKGQGKRFVSVNSIT